MYQRFLNNEDYMSQISDELFNQLIRGQQIRVNQAEEAAEVSIVEYLTDNYEVEKALEVGKNLREYNPRITYPVGVHFYHEGKIVEAMRSINGIKAPATVEYWRECEDMDKIDREIIMAYSQLLNYHPATLCISQVRFTSAWNTMDLIMRTFAYPALTHGNRFRLLPGSPTWNMNRGLSSNGTASSSHFSIRMRST